MAFSLYVPVYKASLLFDFFCISKILIRETIIHNTCIHTFIILSILFFGLTCTSETNQIVEDENIMVKLPLFAEKLKNALHTISGGIYVYIPRKHYITWWCHATETFMVWVSPVDPSDNESAALVGQYPGQHVNMWVWLCHILTRKHMFMVQAHIYFRC
jgi:hypothetical protein